MNSRFKNTAQHCLDAAYGGSGKVCSLSNLSPKKIQPPANADHGHMAP